jgi:hypothetical protein
MGPRSISTVAHMGQCAGSPVIQAMQCLRPSPIQADE